MHRQTVMGQCMGASMENVLSQLTGALVRAAGWPVSGALGSVRAGGLGRATLGAVWPQEVGVGQREEGVQDHDRPA